MTRSGQPSPIRRVSSGLVAFAFAAVGVGCDSGSAEWDGNIVPSANDVEMLEYLGYVTE